MNIVVIKPVTELREGDAVLTDVPGVSSFIVSTVTLEEGTATISLGAVDQTFTVAADALVATYVRPNR